MSENYIKWIKDIFDVCFVLCLFLALLSAYIMHASTDIKIFHFYYDSSKVLTTLRILDWNFGSLAIGGVIFVGSLYIISLHIVIPFFKKIFSMSSYLVMIVVSFSFILFIFRIAFIPPCNISAISAINLLLSIIGKVSDIIIQMLIIIVILIIFSFFYYIYRFNKFYILNSKQSECFHKGEFKEAIDYLTEMVSVLDTIRLFKSAATEFKREIYLELSECHYHLGNFEESIKHLRELGIENNKIIRSVYGENFSETIQMLKSEFFDPSFKKDIFDKYISTKKFLENKFRFLKIELWSGSLLAFTIVLIFFSLNLVFIRKYYIDIVWYITLLITIAIVLFTLHKLEIIHKEYIPLLKTEKKQFNGITLVSVERDFKHSYLLIIVSLILLCLSFAILGYTYSLWSFFAKNYPILGTTFIVVFAAIMLFCALLLTIGLGKIIDISLLPMHFYFKRGYEEKIRYMLNNLW